MPPHLDGALQLPYCSFPMAYRDDGKWIKIMDIINKDKVMAGWRGSFIFEEGDRKNERKERRSLILQLLINHNNKTPRLFDQSFGRRVEYSKDGQLPFQSRRDDWANAMPAPNICKVKSQLIELGII